jgi:signal transduction histidine kinase/DNA-binding response OmpR family regulator
MQPTAVDPETSIARLQARIDHLEENRRYVQNSLEMALWLSDFHAHLVKDNDNDLLLKEAIQRFEKIIPMQACAIYLVDEQTSEFKLALCEPRPLCELVAEQVEFMIEEGLFAWAMRERRGIFTSSNDHVHTFLVHIIANHSQVQGMFIGLLQSGKISVTDTALTLLSITLLNLANVMESMQLYQWVRNQNAILEKKVAERTLKLDRSRQKLKKTMISLEKMAQEAEAANKAKGRFLANMSHEIRTPVNGIIGCAELMLKSGDPEYNRSLARICLNESEHLLNLINNVLDYSKIEAGKIELEKAPIQLEKLLRSVVDGLKIQAQAKSIELGLKMTGDFSRAVMGDTLRLRQVLINLVNNAIKFTDRGSVTLELADVSRSEPGGKHLKFSVVDTGIGIPKHRQDAIFKRFTQVDQSTTRRYGGTGLGTAIAYQLVALMGGELKVDSAPGCGATFSFTITLPQTDTRPEPPAAAIRREPDLGESPAIPARILLAEDTPVNQLVVRSHLEDHGFEVVVADNGKAAVEACGRQKFDLVLMDIQMPEMDGIEAAGHILAQRPPEERMPIVALTADSDAQTRAACEAAGMEAILIKPIRRATLMEEVRGILERHRKRSHDRITGRQGAREDQPPPEEDTPSVPPLDLETAVYEFGGRRVVRQVVEQLIDTGAEQMEEIRCALKDKAFDIIRQRAHAIKGGAATAEAAPLSNVAAELEKQCKAGALDRISQTVERLESAWDALRSHVQAIDWQQEEP